MNFFADNFIKCTGSTIKGTVSKPVPTAKATITSWTPEGCSIYKNNKNVGPATVKVPNPPAVEAISLTQLYIGPITVEATFQIGASTCKPQFTILADNPSYTNGSTTNKLSSLSTDEFIDWSFPLPEACEFAGGAEVSEATASFPNPQFEVEEGNYQSPTVVTNSASGVNQTGATLNGSITPNGLPTEYHFEFGLTEQYGTKVPVPDASLTSTLFTAQAVSRTISGLQTGTPYHYRLVAKNGKGTIYGVDRAFTPSPPPVCDSLSASRIKLGDMNGDGKVDIFRFTNVVDGIGEAQVWRSEGKSFTSLGRVNTGFGLAYQDRLADWDGDGDDDVFQFTEYGRVDGWRSNATSYTQLSQVGSGFADPCETRIADLNGDGRDDILRFTTLGNGYAWISNGTPTNYTYKGLVSTGFGLSNEVRVGDINGDGFDDLFQFTDEGNGYLWRNNGGISFSYLGKFASGFGSANQVRIGDRNGDGRDDLFRFSEEGNGYYWQSKGDGTFTYIGQFTSGFGPSRQVRIADINGDSKSDIVYFSDDGTGQAWLGDGANWEWLGQIGTGFGVP